MTTYRIEHRTTYAYDADVTGSFGQFHLRPRDLPWQTVLEHELVIEPGAGSHHSHLDLYGNTRSTFHVVAPHQERGALVRRARPQGLDHPPHGGADAPGCVSVRQRRRVEQGRGGHATGKPTPATTPGYRSRG